MDFQAVVMAAGRGGRLSPLGDQTAKCLVPIGNIPMLWYPIRSLDLCGCSDVSVLVLKSSRVEVQQALDSIAKRVPWKTKDFRYKLHSVPDMEDEGPATSLLKIATGDRDLLVVSCDLITNIPIKQIAEKHMVHSASLTCLLRRKHKPEGTIPGGKSKSSNKENTIVGMEESEGRLLFISSQADCEDSLPISVDILHKYPDLSVTTQLEDCHLYFISHKVLQEKSLRECSSLRSEFVPTLISLQFSGKKDVEPKQLDEMRLSMDLVTAFSSWTDHAGDMDGPYHDISTRCYAHQSPDNSLCIRANTIPDYYEANKQIAVYDKHFGLTEFRRVPAGYKRSQVGNDSNVGTNLKMAEKSCIKKSAIGANCTIGDNVKINNSIIMDNVSIKDGCLIQTCIICDRCDVGERVELKECIIGASRVLEPKSKLTGEIVTDEADELISQDKLASVL